MSKNANKQKNADGKNEAALLLQQTENQNEKPGDNSSIIMDGILPPPIRRVLV